ncbi:DUF3291 domain-containing protein [Desertivirga arenae]|uniref:DUF3291 domain-containing protein n=1 Tax=Desertivirga arenae TaxID=2810309 RepID=UPI001F608FCF|nr:DUF3291 domain-containing protein [Pedobacter sp. SYSU D00823]
MGSGKNGTFDLKPDFKQWALLAAWKDEQSFESFRKSSFISLWWRKFCTESYTILCSPISSHGNWDNQNPFANFENVQYQGPVAVLTRATIRLNRLKNFWQNVDRVASIMTRAKGYITSFGIGEAPFFRQATFSIWESLDDVKAFAYRSAEHREVIQKTRDENWYSEELFARFKPLATFGTLNGKDPLAGKI